MRLAGVVAFIPFEEAEDEVKHVSAGLFDRQARVAVHAAQDTFELLRVVERLYLPVYPVLGQLRRVVLLDERQLEVSRDAQSYGVVAGRDGGGASAGRF